MKLTLKQKTSLVRARKQDELHRTVGQRAQHLERVSESPA